MREDQLSDAAHDFKHQMEQTNRRHEELLIAYKYADDILDYQWNPALSLSSAAHFYMKQSSVHEEGTIETAVNNCCWKHLIYSMG